jgi:HPt (histidine-containing phosphotransfer) domain-containing protein
MLQPVERAEIDARRLNALIRDMGQPSAERLLGRALDEIEDRLRRADRAAAGGDFRAASRAARQIVPIAEAVGLSGISRVATMAARTAEAGDGPALAATLLRIERLGQAAVRAVGEAWHARL